MMKPLVMTLGEPAGIGPDCALLLWQERPALFESLVVVAPVAWLRGRMQELHLSVPLFSIDALDGIGQQQGIYCYQPPNVDGSGAVVAGAPSVATAGDVVASISWAAQACLDGRAQAMVTGPIEKSVLRDNGFTFPGHTEFLAHLCGQREVVMMLACERLRVALLTTHLAIRDVPCRLTTDGCVTIATLLDRDLRYRFAIEKPRLGLCALNPHAGEQGHFGDEEARILMPAVVLLQASGIDITGPLPADTLFSPQMRDRFDAIICCYHDQALIPLKMEGFGEAVNVSLGLKLIRTSVDHGTALDRAGSGDIHCGSLASAIVTARNMVENSRGNECVSPGLNGDVGAC